jgi:hypothetical protein
MIFAGCAGLKGWSLAGSAGFHGLNTGTPDGGGLGFLLKLVFTAESLGNGFICDSPMTAFLSLSQSRVGWVKPTFDMVGICQRSGHCLCSLGVIPRRFELWRNIDWKVGFTHPTRLNNGWLTVAGRMLNA